MPIGFTPDEGLPGEALRRLNPGAFASHVTRLILWVNDITPDHDTVVADLTPATFGGYIFATLVDSLWQTPELVSGCASVQYDTVPITWTVATTAGETLYGWALLDVDDDVIRFVQRFEPGDVNPLAVGDVVRLLPLITFDNHTCGAMAFRAAHAKIGRARGRKNAR